MNDSLKEKLLDQIKSRQGKVFTHREMVLFCMDEDKKPDNGTRRLREVRDPLHEDYDPSIQVFMKNGAIMGYYWQPQGSQTLNLPSRTNVYHTIGEYCCGDRVRGLNSHSKDCKVKQEIKQRTLGI